MSNLFGSLGGTSYPRPASTKSSYRAFENRREFYQGVVTLHWVEETQTKVAKATLTDGTVRQRTSKLINGSMARNMEDFPLPLEEHWDLEYQGKYIQGV